MECAAKGSADSCVPGPPTRRCGNCGAVAYCSLTHQKMHWNDHKEECARFEQQMQRAVLLSDLPFSFSKNSGSVGFERQLTRCSFLALSGLHRKALWKFECSCWAVAASDNNSRVSGQKLNFQVSAISSKGLMMDGTFQVLYARAVNQKAVFQLAYKVGRIITGGEACHLIHQPLCYFTGHLQSFTAFNFVLPKA